MAIPAETFTLPGPPETAQALSARRAVEARDDNDDVSPNRMISRAIFAAGRLWLLVDGGDLSSLVETDRALTTHDAGEPVLDLCVHDGLPTVLTGRRDGGAAWTIRQWQRAMARGRLGPPHR